MGYGAVFCVKMGQARWPGNVMVREKTGLSDVEGIVMVCHL